LVLLSIASDTPFMWENINYFTVCSVKEIEGNSHEEKRMKRLYVDKAHKKQI
jgi:hypothetical protein